jgi:hypothetical protein
MYLRYDTWWADPDRSWSVKVDRARVHLESLRQQVKGFMSSAPYVLRTETEAPGVTAYRLRVARQFPTSMISTIGDVLHNQRSALEHLAYGMAAACQGGTLPPSREGDPSFPICKTADDFERWFKDRKRRGLYDDRAVRAFREVQPFRWGERAAEAGAKVGRTEDDDLIWNDLHRLDRLWNIDKHRRLALLSWWPELIWWGSSGPSNRSMLRGDDGPPTDGKILFRIKGDDGPGFEINHEFNIVLQDDPAFPRCEGHTVDVLDLLEQFQAHITGPVLTATFAAMSEAIPA